MTQPPRLTNQPPRGGFTLIELLVVIVLITILVALLTPAVLPLLRASNLNTGASLLTDELNLARQLALTQNRDVEVRLYRIAPKTDPGNLQFRAFRCFYLDNIDPAKSKPLSAIKHLPVSVIMTPDPVVSTLLDTENPERVGLTKAQEILPGMTNKTDYVSFLFRATGGTNLTPITPPIGNWFLTLYLENSAVDPATHLPANYFTAQVEPVTGRVRSFRP
jgi:uncharacterized protein (TIGR02596 family)